MHAAIWDWDVPNRRVFYSPRWKELRGFAEDEITDEEKEWSERIHPEDAPRVHAAYDGGWAEYLYAVPEAFLYRVPPGLPLRVAVMTFGVALVLRGLARIEWGTNLYSLPTFPGVNVTYRFIFDRVDMFIDITLAYAVLNFIGTIAIAKYLLTLKSRGKP